MSRLQKHVESLPEWKQIYHGKYRTELVTRVSQILEEKGWTQSDLADALDCSDAYVSKLLSGNANLTFKTVSKLEAALGEDVLRVTWSLKSEYGELFHWISSAHAPFKEVIEEEFEDSGGVWKKIAKSRDRGFVVRFGELGTGKHEVDTDQFEEMEITRGDPIALS